MILLLSQEIITKGGFDKGKAVLEYVGEKYELTYVNEFMTLENSKGQRLATFSNLITSISNEVAKPVLSAELKENMKVHSHC